MKHVLFELGGAPHGPLRGDVYLPQQSRGAPVVICCHGFKGFKDWGFWPETGRRLSESGLVTVIFNFSGSGIGDEPDTFCEFDRFEANTIGKELEDLGAVLDAVARREVPVGDADIRSIGLLGHSRGGGVSLVRAGRDPRVRALVTWAAVSSFQRYTPQDLDLWRKQGYLEVVNARTGQVFKLGVGLLEDLETHGDAYNPLVAIRRLRIPALLVHGTRDESVPVEEGQELAKAGGPGTARLALIQDAGHTFGAVHPFTESTPALDQALEKTTAWFRDAFEG